MILHQHYNFLFISLFRCSQLNSNISKKFILQSLKEMYLISNHVSQKKENINHNYNSIENDGKNNNSSRKKNKIRITSLAQFSTQEHASSLYVRIQTKKKKKTRGTTRDTYTASIPFPFFPLSSRTKFPDVCETQTEPEQRGGLECRPPLFIKAQSGTHRGTEFQSDAGVPVGRHSIVDRYICLSESCGHSIWIGIFYRVKLANDRSITGRKISIKSLNYRPKQSGN